MDNKQPLTAQKSYPPATTIGTAHIVGMAYEVMHTLCTCPLFNQQLPAFLRTDFVYRHLELVPVTRPCDYLQNCWVVSLVCVEMQSGGE